MSAPDGVEDRILESGGLVVLQVEVGHNIASVCAVSVFVLY